MADPDRVVLTPRAIAAGEPGALEALVRRRGSSVLAYAQVVAPAHAEIAAAEALARFQAAAAGAAVPRELDPEALLHQAVAHAAAQAAGAEPPATLVARADAAYATPPSAPPDEGFVDLALRVMGVAGAPLAGSEAGGAVLSPLALGATVALLALLVVLVIAGAFV